MQTSSNACIEHHMMCDDNEPGNAKMPNDEIKDKIRNAILESPVERRELFNNVRPRENIMIYKKINVTDEERIRVYNNVLEESQNIDYISPNTHTFTNDPGFEVIDNVDDNDHIRFF